ncbi:MAG TPA: hypothetical protein ENN12_03980 [Epsilonproteobacteria bacterium]|nr:hypothetical protein [Campylobacterota bacterium]
MYQKEFEAILQTNLPKALLLYGENDFAIDEIINIYIDRLDVSQSVAKFYFEEWNFEQAKSHLTQNSLFGGVNLVLIKHSKTLPKKEIEALIGMTKTSQNNYLLYAHYGTPKEVKPLLTLFGNKSDAVNVRFFEPNQKEAIQTITKEALKLSLDIDNYAVGRLALLLENNLSLCKNELQKLTILDRPITAEDIDTLVYSTAPLRIEKLLTDVFQKKPIIPTITTLLALGEDENDLLRATQTFANQIFLFQAYIKLHGHLDISAILGYRPPKHIEEQKASLANKIKTPALLKILEYLLYSELAIKKAPNTQKEALLYTMFVTIQSYL